MWVIWFVRRREMSFEFEIVFYCCVFVCGFVFDVICGLVVEFCVYCWCCVIVCVLFGLIVSEFKDIGFVCIVDGYWDLCCDCYGVCYWNV